MNAFGFSALLVGWLCGHPVPGVDEDWSRTEARVMRLAVVLLAQLALFLGLTVVVLA
jgi:hypothetical protein